MNGAAESRSERDAASDDAAACVIGDTSYNTATITLTHRSSSSSSSNSNEATLGGVGEQTAPGGQVGEECLSRKQTVGPIKEAPSVRLKNTFICIYMIQLVDGGPRQWKPSIRNCLSAMRNPSELWPSII